MSKKIYVVRGSEDGNLGVYSNVKNAYARANEYFSDCDEVASKSYAAVCKKLKDISWVSIDAKSDRIAVEIEMFWLNS